MGVEDRGYNDVDGTICLSHLTDPIVSAACGAATSSVCTFCGRTGGEGEAPFAVEMQTFMETFMDTFWHHYGRESNVLYAGGESWGATDTTDAVAELAGETFAADDEEVLLQVIAAIDDAIIDTEVSNDADTDHLSFAWDRFSYIAKHVSRFIAPGSMSGRAPMVEVRDFLQDLLTYVDGDHNAVTTLPAGTAFFRGRLTENRIGKIPTSVRDLGPAPEAKAAANRMSPAGIPLFYASADAATAIAEIAFHGVEPFAVMGTFVSQVPLRVLDLTTTPARPSLFDLTKLRESLMLGFLEEFAEAITRPILPDGRQHIDYVPTQVITEYFRWAPQTRLDGIALPSTQTGRTTYVLFVASEQIDSTHIKWPVHSFPDYEPWMKDVEELGTILIMDDEQTTLFKVNRRVDPEDVGFAFGSTAEQRANVTK